MAKRTQILNPIFIACLILLLLNDFYLKRTFANDLTGKLSDFAGLIVFPVFIAYLFPSTKKWISISTGILFVIWKTPFTTPIIEYFNQILPFTIQRIVDYTDYWALLVLPLAHTIINRETRQIISTKKLLFTKIAIASVAFFAICATTLPPTVETPKGTVYIGKQYTIKKSKVETIEMIKSLGYNVDYYENPGSDPGIGKYRSWRTPYYQTDNIVIFDDYSNPTDTILHVKYTLDELKKNKTKIEIINVTLSEDGNIQRWQTLKSLRKQYKNLIKKQIIKEIK